MVMYSQYFIVSATNLMEDNSLGWKSEDRRPELKKVKRLMQRK